MAVLLSLAMVFSLAVTDVHAAATSGKKVWLKRVSTPTTVNMGDPFSIRGKIKAKSKIYKVQVGIVNVKTGKWRFRYTLKNINKKSFNLKKADSTLKFGKLKEGIYYYRINVQLKGKSRQTLLNQRFAVVNNKAETIPLSVADSTSLTLSGVRCPGTYNVGKEFNTTGIVSCASKIKKVEIGIVFAPTNKWTDYKYTANVNTNDYDLSKVASRFRFDLLPGGDYRYRMYVHTENGVMIAFNKEFTVLPSAKPKAAVNWAIRIANDDTFTYGEKPIANQQGCYFCGNNDRKVTAAKKKKMEDPERYEKTYVCLTFVGAAYAHGAGDPEILKACQKRYMTMYETNDNFRKFSCWMKIGACKDLTVNDLQPGDVIIKWSDHNDNNGHVCMYIGGNDIVESSGGGWSANSIAVKRDVAARRLASLSSSSKNYVMRYRLP
jgi:hypothetical protein